MPARNLHLLQKLIKSCQQGPMQHRGCSCCKEIGQDAGSGAARTGLSLKLSHRPDVCHAHLEACQSASHTSEEPLCQHSSYGMLHILSLNPKTLNGNPNPCAGHPEIAEAPVAFECTLWETLETTSRHIFIGRVHRLHARDELIDTETWRVRLQHYFPVGRFGASDYVTTRERFTLG